MQQFSKTQNNVVKPIFTSKKKQVNASNNNSDKPQIIDLSGNDTEPVTGDKPPIIDLSGSNI